MAVWFQVKVRWSRDYRLYARFVCDTIASLQLQLPLVALCECYAFLFTFTCYAVHVHIQYYHNVQLS